MKQNGTIQALNVSPKGFYEGILLQTGQKIVQVNLLHDQAAVIGKTLELGQEITLEVEREEPHGTPAHEVFRMVRILSTQGQEHLAHANSQYAFAGLIDRLNYALHGEVNGGLLDSGDFLHLKPEGARAVALKAGMRVEGHGVAKPMIGGHLVIEAEEVNGIAIRHHAPGKKPAAKKAKGH